MKLASRLLLQVLTSAASLPTAYAATVSAMPTPLTVERPISLLMRTLDENHDGKLSAEELRLAPIALTALDIDGDGFLSPDELSPSTRSRVPHRATVQLVSHVTVRTGADFNLLLALDANHDGVIQPIELANSASSLARLDRNGDGILTPNELRPRRET